MTVPGNHITVGTSSSCDVTLPDNPYIQSEHIRIRKVLNKWMAEAVGNWSIQVGDTNPARMGWLEPNSTIKLAQQGPTLVFLEAIDDASRSKSDTMKTSPTMQPEIPKSNIVLPSTPPHEIPTMQVPPKKPPAPSQPKPVKAKPGTSTPKPKLPPLPKSAPPDSSPSLQKRGKKEPVPPKPSSGPKPKTTPVPKKKPTGKPSQRAIPTPGQVKKPTAKPKSPPIPSPKPKQAASSGSGTSSGSGQKKLRPICKACKVPLTPIGQCPSCGKRYRIK